MDSNKRSTARLHDLVLWQLHKRALPRLVVVTCGGYFIHPWPPWLACPSLPLVVAAVVPASGQARFYEEEVWARARLPLAASNQMDSRKALDRTVARLVLWQLHERAVSAKIGRLDHLWLYPWPPWLARPSPLLVVAVVFSFFG